MTDAMGPALGAAGAVSSAGTALGIIAALFGLLVVAAAAVAFFRASYARATIETLRDSNTALTARVTELEASETRLQTRCTSLEREAETLRSLASGAGAVGALREELATQHGAILAELAAIRRGVEDR